MTYFSILIIHHGYCLNKQFHILEGMHFGEVNLLPRSHIGQGVAGQTNGSQDYHIFTSEEKWFQQIIQPISKLPKNKKVLFH